ncbi:acyl-CoA dehydrogenase [Actinomadura logoneensis]|uniref:Acyl-CoA dehydrogenase n=1 Tax=Actinomadura logoneensis TaxID=2293572 RepID=A0A372JCJ5_9ACTN|nr:acyl-CoA dehydrogenase family protein [Actinomadura logoneensis]RFU37731.1 acyl-CoA dehydrogenase [Actinomadura logoneensis]
MTADPRTSTPPTPDGAADPRTYASHAPVGADDGLTEAQRTVRAEFAAFADEHLVPHADRWDRDEHLPREVVDQVAKAGHLGAAVPARYGGTGLDAVALGLLHGETGRACSSVRSLLTVHSMVAHALVRWGSADQRRHWLPRLADGTALGAFAVTEPDAGSDLGSVATSARADDRGGGYVLTGCKHWITFGQYADVFLVLARLDAGGHAAFLVERDRPGLDVEPMTGALGTRASMLARVHLNGCRVPADHLVGRPGFGLSAVVATALELGRYSVAWGCAGLAEACLRACLAHADRRHQFGGRLRGHQLVQRMLADMATGATAARLLCLRAGRLREAGDPASVHATWMAKYFASTAASRAAGDAVQIHGARGVGPDAPVQRYLRDARVMEIIEGSTQLQQIVLADAAYQLFPPETERTNG